MKQIHIWPHHVRIADLDLVIYRSADETIDQTLRAIARLGFSIDAENVEVHLPAMAA